MLLYLVDVPMYAGVTSGDQVGYHCITTFGSTPSRTKARRGWVYVKMHGYLERASPTETVPLRRSVGIARRLLHINTMSTFTMRWKMNITKMTPVTHIPLLIIVDAWGN